MQEDIKMKKALSVAAVVVGALVLLSVSGPSIAALLAAVSPAASVGIIGGADGPTAIMVAGTNSPLFFIVPVIIGILLIAVGIWGIKKLKQSV